MKWRETHYALICDVLRDFDARGPRQSHDLLAVWFADALEGTNERFDRARFIAEATGVKA